MSSLLKALEPREFAANTEIIYENTSVFELYFLTQGEVVVMEEKPISQQKVFSPEKMFEELITIESGHCIGHEMVLDFKTIFRFKSAESSVKCFSLRKSNWRNIIRQQQPTKERRLSFNHVLHNFQRRLFREFQDLILKRHFALR